MITKLQLCGRENTALPSLKSYLPRNTSEENKKRLNKKE